MFYQIIFHGFDDESTVYIHEGTNIEEVYANAYAQYATLCETYEDDSSDFPGYKRCHSLLEFSLKKPTYIPTNYISWIHILYRQACTDTDYNLYKED